MYTHSNGPEFARCHISTPEAAALELIETAVLAHKPFESRPKGHPRGETPGQIGDARNYAPRRL